MQVPRATCSSDGCRGSSAVWPGVPRLVGTVAEMRSLLRFLDVQGFTPGSLTESVPRDSIESSPARWRRHRDGTTAR
jgi:hypothetical protein